MIDQQRAAFGPPFVICEGSAVLAGCIGVRCEGLAKGVGYSKIRAPTFLGRMLVVYSEKRGRMPLVFADREGRIAGSNQQRQAVDVALVVHYTFPSGQAG